MSLKRRKVTGWGTCLLLLPLGAGCGVEERDLFLVSAPPSLDTAFPIRPILECVEEGEDGLLIAHFGYLNQNAQPVTLPAGSPHNRFAGPSQADRGQVQTFNPGRQIDVFQVAFDASRRLTWTLISHDDTRITATASSTSARCIR